LEEPHVPEILVRGLGQKTVKRLKKRARLSGRSLQQEVKSILERAATTLTMDEARRLSETWHRRLAGRSFSDSAELIRQDRDSR
jgi:plasmid stability protein